MGFGDWGVGIRVWGSGFRVSGFGFRVSGFGFRVEGFGLRVYMRPPLALGRRFPLLPLLPLPRFPAREEFRNLNEPKRLLVCSMKSRSQHQSVDDGARPAQLESRGSKTNGVGPFLPPPPSMLQGEAQAGGTPELIGLIGRGSPTFWGFRVQGFEWRESRPRPARAPIPNTFGVLSSFTSIRGDI